MSLATSTILSSDPNAFVGILDLLMVRKAVGNTGLRNKLMAVCDELLRQNTHQ